MQIPCKAWLSSYLLYIIHNIGSHALTPRVRRVYKSEQPLGRIG